jgi:hypothetical protein
MNCLSRHDDKTIEKGIVISVLSFVSRTTATTMMNTKMKKRDLHSSDEEYYSPYFEKYDADGDSYSLSWRYLGAFIDEDDEYYTRKVLWAAVSISRDDDTYSFSSSSSF